MDLMKVFAIGPELAEMIVMEFWEEVMSPFAEETEETEGDFAASAHVDMVQYVLLTISWTSTTRHSNCTKWLVAAAAALTACFACKYCCTARVSSFLALASFWAKLSEVLSSLSAGFLYLLG